MRRMRFSPISAPQRNATSVVDIGLAEPHDPPARPRRLDRQAECRARCRQLRRRCRRRGRRSGRGMATTGSSSLPLTTSLAPSRRARSSFAASRSTATMRPAPASRAPCTADRPTAPQPMTMRARAVADAAKSERRADTGHDPAADQASAVERHRRRHAHARSAGTMAVFGERARRTWLRRGSPPRARRVVPSNGTACGPSRR